MASSMLQQLVPLEEFVDEVWNNIPEDWQNLIMDSNVLRPVLDYKLGEEHERFRPNNGEWLAEPHWEEMFAWMDCPASKIQAIIVDMKPLRPNSYSYRSLGCALGVQRRLEAGQSPDIRNLTTVWNFLHLVHEVTGAQWSPTDMAEKFHNGFNPLYLSANKNMLFVQLQPVTGPWSPDDCAVERDNEWATQFTIPLLEEIGALNAAAGLPPIPVIQLYNNRSLEGSLDNFNKGGWFRVFRPSFMSIKNISGPHHIVGFQNHTFQKYVEEINADQYAGHCKIFSEIQEIIGNHPELLTFTDSDIEA